jgi:hypothetical protein
MAQKFRYNPNTLSYDKVKQDYNWGKVFLLIVIISAILYFLVGGAFVIWGNFQLNSYFNLGGIFGALASIAGLFSLISSRIKRSDIEEIGLDYFKDVIKASENLKQKEADLKAREQQVGLKEKEIQELEVKKAELELLVQKASMTIYLKDRLSRLDKEIIDLINQDKNLMQRIRDRETTKDQILKLKEEIDANEETEKVEEIIALVKHVEESQNSKNENKSFLEAYLESVGNIVSRITRF